MMKHFVAAAALLASVSAKVYLPEKKYDELNWRILPILPYVFLNDSLFYVIFLADDGNYVMTIRGKIDNNRGEAIHADNIDNVARGFFIRDKSYGFDFVEGFVVTYEPPESWRFTSLLIEK